MMLLWPSGLRLLPWVATLLVLWGPLVLLLSVWLAVILLMPLVLLITPANLSELRRHLGRPTSQVDVYPTCVRLGGVL